ncbi:MAG: hypothetical protein JNK23_10625 [Opitutaceae bacterium]|nr:hypothetical protein [Opitutaceae bacterium]
MSGVSILLDEATPLLARVKSAAAAQGLALVGARAVASLVKDHLYGLDSQRHKYGSHYYRQAGDSVRTEVVPQGAVVSISQIGFRLRLFGGTVRAKNVRLLTIPAHPDAYGKRAREFDDLDFSFQINPKTGALQPCLVRRAQTTLKYSRRKGKDGAVNISVRAVSTLDAVVMYWLTPSVTHDADPSVLPYAEQMSLRAVTAMRTRLMRATLRQARETGYQDPEKN